MIDEINDSACQKHTSIFTGSCSPTCPPTEPVPVESSWPETNRRRPPPTRIRNSCREKMPWREADEHRLGIIFKLSIINMWVSKVIKAKTIVIHIHYRGVLDVTPCET